MGDIIYLKTVGRRTVIQQCSRRRFTEEEREGTGKETKKEQRLALETGVAKEKERKREGGRWKAKEGEGEAEREGVQSSPLKGNIANLHRK